MSRLYVYFFFIVFLTLVGYQVYKMEGSRRELQAELTRVSHDYQALVENNQDLDQKIQYFSDPYNLEKELRARFNYKSPGEKLIIVAPKSGG